MWRTAEALVLYAASWTLVLALVLGGYYALF